MKRPVIAPAQSGTGEHAKLHRLISIVFEPSLFLSPFILVIVYTRRHLFSLDLVEIYGLLFLMGGVVPGLYTLTLYKLELISTLFYSRRRDRAFFYPMLIAVAGGGFLLFAYASSSTALQSAAFAATSVSAGLAAMTFWHKFSYHLAGLGGGLSIAVALVGYWGFLFLPIMVLVAYSRVRLREHTWLEVSVGGLFGMIVGGAAYSWFSANGELILNVLPGRGA